MELLLNLAGLVVAVAMVCLWLQWAPRAAVDRRTQLVALALLILILFPVISVTDDLLALQNPAETDSIQRRDHESASLHSTFPMASWLPEPAVAELPMRLLRSTASSALQQPIVNSPALAPIQNRPPPAA